ncbi:MAG: class I SAM-dependent methyltransferase [Bacteroidota bacterium]
MLNPEDYISALIDLYTGLERQGPGDEALLRQILADIPELPPNPRIADLGCGAGAASLLLAEYFNSPVLAVDQAAPFLAQLRNTASARGLDHLIMTLEADFAALNWEAQSIDLLWSEGAAYNLGFERALQTWRPIIADGGVAVISEMNWYTPDAPENAREFWDLAYPGMGSEEENIVHASSCAFKLLQTHRLSQQAWWDNYYNPLKERIKSLRQTSDHVMQTVIHETDTEIDLFERFGYSYGYTFYVLQAT